MSTPRTHPLNVSYLVVGLVFLGLAGSWALRTSGAVDTAEVRWLMPLILVMAGAIGLIAFAAKGLSRGRHDQTPGPASDHPAFDPYPTTEPTDSTDQTDSIYPTDQTGDQTGEPTTRIEGEQR